MHIRYNRCGKYVNWFSLLVYVQMLKYLCLFFNDGNNFDKVFGELRCWTIVMAPKRKPSSSQQQGKRPFDSNEPTGKRKVQFENDLFILRSIYERYKSYFFNMTMLPCRDIYFVQRSQSKFGEYYI